MTELNQLPPIFVQRPFDRPDELELEWKSHYLFILEKCKDQSDQQINQILETLSVSSAEAHSNLTIGLVYGVLADKSAGTKFFQYLEKITRDNYSECVTHLKDMIYKKYQKLDQEPKNQLLWLIEALIECNAIKLEGLLIILLRFIQTGNIQKATIWLVEKILKITTKYKKWLYEQQELIPHLVYTFFSIIPDHFRSVFDQIRQSEVTLGVELLRQKWSFCASIGRDLVRIVHNVSRIPEVERVFHDLFLVPTQPGQSPPIRNLYFNPTSKQFFANRIPPEVENWFKWMFQSVQMRNQKRYQTWFATKYLTSPESESLIPDLIRWICGSIHPTRNVLKSDIVPRWAILGWLISITKNPHFNQYSRLCLFYDWIFFVPQKDNIMNLEPGILVIVHSLLKYAEMSSSLADYLLHCVDNYLRESFPQARNDIKSSVGISLKTLVDYKVVNTLDPLLNFSGVRQSIRDGIKRLYESGIKLQQFRANEIVQSQINKNIEQNHKLNQQNTLNSQFNSSGKNDQEITSTETSSSKSVAINQNDSLKSDLLPHDSTKTSEFSNKPEKPEKSHTFTATSLLGSDGISAKNRPNNKINNPASPQVIQTASNNLNIHNLNSNYNNVSESTDLSPATTTITSSTSLIQNFETKSAPKSFFADNENENNSKMFMDDDDNFSLSWKEAISSSNLPGRLEESLDSDSLKDRIFKQQRDELLAPYREFLHELDSPTKQHQVKQKSINSILMVPPSWEISEEEKRKKALDSILILYQNSYVKRDDQLIAELARAIIFALSKEFSEPLKLDQVQNKVTSRIFEWYCKNFNIKKKEILSQVKAKKVNPSNKSSELETKKSEKHKSNTLSNDDKVRSTEKEKDLKFDKDTSYTNKDLRFLNNSTNNDLSSNQKDLKCEDFCDLKNRDNISGAKESSSNNNNNNNNNNQNTKLSKNNDFFSKKKDPCYKAGLFELSFYLLVELYKNEPSIGYRLFAYLVSKFYGNNFDFIRPNYKIDVNEYVNSNSPDASKIDLEIKKDEFEKYLKSIEQSVISSENEEDEVDRNDIDFETSKGKSNKETIPVSRKIENDIQYNSGKNSKILQRECEEEKESKIFSQNPSSSSTSSPSTKSIDECKRKNAELIKDISSDNDEVKRAEDEIENRRQMKSTMNVKSHNKDFDDDDNMDEEINNLEDDRESDTENKSDEGSNASEISELFFDKKFLGNTASYISVYIHFLSAITALKSNGHEDNESFGSREHESNNADSNLLKSSGNIFLNKLDSIMELEDAFVEEAKFVAENDLYLFNQLFPFWFKDVSELAVGNEELVKLVSYYSLPKSISMAVSHLILNTYEIIGSEIESTIIASLQWETVAQTTLWSVINAEFQSSSDLLVEKLNQIICRRINPKTNFECLTGLQQFLCAMFPSKVVIESILVAPLEISDWVSAILTCWLRQGYLEELTKLFIQALNMLASGAQRTRNVRSALLHLTIWHKRLFEETKELLNDTDLNNKINSLINAYNLTEFCFPILTGNSKGQEDESDSKKRRRLQSLNEENEMIEKRPKKRKS